MPVHWCLLEIRNRFWLVFDVTVRLLCCGRHPARHIASVSHSILYGGGYIPGARFGDYLAAGPLQHSTSPYANPLFAIPKKIGGIRIPNNYD